MYKYEETDLSIDIGGFGGATDLSLPKYMRLASRRPSSTALPKLSAISEILRELCTETRAEVVRKGSGLAEQLLWRNMNQRFQLFLSRIISCEEVTAKSGLVVHEQGFNGNTVINQ